MSSCCSEPDCTRKTPILVRPETFGGGWVAVTNYSKGPGNPIRANTKHRLDAVSVAHIELRNSVLEDLFTYVKEAWSGTADGSDSDRAYRDVLDKIAELTKAKESALGLDAERAS